MANKNKNSSHHGEHDLPEYDPDQTDFDDFIDGMSERELLIYGLSRPDVVLAMALVCGATLFVIFTILGMGVLVYGLLAISLIFFLLCAFKRWTVNKQKIQQNEAEQL